MLTAESAGLVMSVAKGVMKIAGRMDRLAAEQEAVQGKLVLPMPNLTLSPRVAIMAKELRLLLEEPEPGSKPLSDKDREELRTLLAKKPLTSAALMPSYKRFLSNRLRERVLRPDSRYVKDLRAARPDVDWNDKGNLLAAFYLKSGKDERGKDYTWGAAMIVVDVLAELGAENSTHLTNDPRAGKVMKAVLERFADSDVENVGTWGGLLGKVLSATLNGALDARDTLDGDTEWVESVLAALDSARGAAKKDDDFLIGLLKGQGYRLLIGAALEQGAKTLGAEGAKPFEKIASEVLKTAAPLARTNQGFASFFDDHWGDLLRAGLRGVEQQGPLLLAGQKPVLKTTLVAMVGHLAKTPNAAFLDRDTLIDLVDVSVGAVAAKPELIIADGTAPWVADLLSGAVGVLAEKGVQQAFSRTGAVAVLRSSLHTMSKHPGVLVEHEGVLQKVVGGVFASLATTKTLGALDLADAAVTGALEAVAANPKLLDLQYPELVADLAGRVAANVKKRSISSITGAELLKDASGALVANPALFLKLERKLATVVVDSVFKAADSDTQKLLTGATLVATVQQLLQQTGRNGTTLLARTPIAELGPALDGLLANGLAQAQKSLGKGLDMPAIPKTLGLLFADCATNGFDNLDPNNAAFQELFDQLAESAAA